MAYDSDLDRPVGRDGDERDAAGRPTRGLGGSRNPNPRNPRNRFAARSTIDPRTVGGALTLAAILLLAVAGILAVLAAVDALGDSDGRGPDTASGPGSVGVVVLLLGLLLLACAWMAWSGYAPTAGVLGLVAGLILVLLYPDTAGILALLGGGCILAARGVPDRRFA